MQHDDKPDYQMAPSQWGWAPVGAAHTAYANSGSNGSKQNSCPNILYHSGCHQPSLDPLPVNVCQTSPDPLAMRWPADPGTSKPSSCQSHAWTHKLTSKASRQSHAWTHKLTKEADKAMHAYTSSSLPSSLTNTITTPCGAQNIN